MKLSCKLCRLPSCPQGPAAHWHVQDTYIGIVFTALTQAECSAWIHDTFLPTFNDARRKREASSPTGRVSTPNLQNIPIRTERGHKIRTQFVPLTVAVPEVVPNPAIEEVESALVNLRMGRAQAKKLVAEIVQLHPTAGFEELFRACVSSNAKR